MFAREVAPGIEGMLSPFLEEGERLPDLSLVAELLVRGAEARLGLLEEADAADAEAREALAVARREHEAACGRLRGMLRELVDLSRLLSICHPRVRRLEFGGLALEWPWLLRSAEVVLERLPEMAPAMAASSLVSGEVAGFAVQVERAVDRVRVASRVMGERVEEVRVAERERVVAEVGFLGDRDGGIGVLAALTRLGAVGVVE